MYLCTYVTGVDCDDGDEDAECAEWLIDLLLSIDGSMVGKGQELDMPSSIV